MSALGSGVVASRDYVPNLPMRPEGATVTAGSTFTRGWMLMRAAAGTAQVATEVAGLLPGGFADRSLVAADAGNNDFVNMETGILSVDMSGAAGDAFLDTDLPGPIYAINNNEFGKLPVNPTTGALRSIAGCFLRLDRPLTGSKCLAMIGVEGVALALGVKASTLTVVPTYRAVITTIAAYAGTLTGTLTGSVNGAIGAQDGVTLVAGDRVILPVRTGGAAGATVAADQGPYIVVSPGGAGKFVLTRPPEYQQGALIPEDFTVKIGEGTIWAGNEWRAFPASAALVIGTGDPAFWPRTYAAVLTAAGANTTFWLKDVNKIAATNLTAAHAFWFSTLTAGAGNGAVTITGTGGETFATFAVNY